MKKDNIIKWVRKREPKPIMVTHEPYGQTLVRIHYHCRRCGHEMIYHDNYCGACGGAIDWSKEDK